VNLIDIGEVARVGHGDAEGTQLGCASPQFGVGYRGGKILNGLIELGRPWPGRLACRW